MGQGTEDTYYQHDIIIDVNLDHLIEIAFGFYNHKEHTFPPFPYYTLQSEATVQSSPYLSGEFFSPPMKEIFYIVICKYG